MSILYGSFGSPMSMRCEYCADCSHLTVECPGLGHDNPITRAFKERHFGTRRECSTCGQPEYLGRKMFVRHSMVERGDVNVCGDCMARGTPLTLQPVKQEPPRTGAWMTPAWEDVS